MTGFLVQIGALAGLTLVLSLSIPPAPAPGRRAGDSALIRAGDLLRRVR